MITKGDGHIGRYLYLKCASEFSDAVNDLRITNTSGVITFEKCTVSNATKGAGTWVEYAYESANSNIQNHIGNSDIHVTTTDKSNWNGKQAANLKFTDTSASSWVADTLYTNYGYKCELTFSGVDATDIAEVTFGHTEAISGNYSPVCLTSTNKVTIYAKVNTTITIPTILINKQS